MKHSLRKGLLVGAVLGTAYALLTTRKTGLERQHHLRQYVDDLTTSTKNITKSVQRFKSALGNLQKEVTQTAMPTLAALQKDVEDYQFQTEPRVKALTEHVNQLQEQVAKSLPAQDLTEQTKQD